MSNAVCLPDDCQQTLLYEKAGDTLTPFFRLMCVGPGGVATTKDFDLSGQDRHVEGEVVADPSPPAACCRHELLYEQVSDCMSVPFIRRYRDSADGTVEIANYNLDGASVPVTGAVNNKPPSRSVSKKKMCDAAGGEPFFRWYVSCEGGVLSTYDTELNGAPYSASDAIYAGECLCKPVTMRQQLCDTVRNSAASPIGTFRENPSWTLRNGVVVSRTVFNKGALYGVFSKSLNIFTFSVPVDVDFGLDSNLAGEKQIRVMGDVNPYWIDDRVAVWDPVGRTAYFVADHLAISGNTSGTDGIVYIKFKGTNITQITVVGAHLNELEDRIIARFEFLTASIVSRTPFSCTMKFDGAGNASSLVDTTLAGDSYVLLGDAEECLAG